MMDHIRLHDWGTRTDSQSFINLADSKDSVIEKILRNQFLDPLLTLGRVEERETEPINWDEVFGASTNSKHRTPRIFIPALRHFPPYPKLSSLTQKEHSKCLRVLCAQNPHVLPGYFTPRPYKSDYRLFEEVKEKYESEKKEYIEWAKSQWLNGGCIKALRPKPSVEVTYEAEFKMRSHTVQSFPKQYTMAAQIPLRKEGSFVFKLKKELINVDISELPEISYPKNIESQFTVLRGCSMPEPCIKHPCRFILPNEKSVSMLPLTEVARELAQYGVERGAAAVASEGALRCLLETDRSWILPISVCQAIAPDGDKVNVIVMGSEFAIQEEPAQRRTYRALKHMLHSAFILPEEKAKIIDKSMMNESDNKEENKPQLTDDDSDDDDRLLIDIQDDLHASDQPSTSTDIPKDKSKSNKRRHSDKSTNSNDEEARSPSKKRPRLGSDEANDIGIFSCMCKDTIFETPPPRSFKLWEVKDKKNRKLQPFNIIIHCAHKTRKDANEVILEPIPEFLIEVAGTEQSQEKRTSLALSLMLRKQAILVNARIDGNVGDLATVEEKTFKEISTDGTEQAISETMYSVLDQFTGLLPGNYVLVHEPSHGSNALLYRGGGGEPLRPQARDEAALVQQPPHFAPVLLPYHKFQNILPCAFTPYENQVAKDKKKAATKQKKPHDAITLQSQGETAKSNKYPKRKKKKGKKKK